MEYFKIDGVDYSMYVRELKITNKPKYNSQTNAAGNTVVDLINRKRKIKVGFIPLDEADMVRIQQAIDNFNVSISFRNPLTNSLEDNVNCIVPSNEVDYYTIRVGKVSYKKFSITFEEL